MANVNARDHNGMTPLMAASLRIFFTHRNVNTVDSQGMTALMRVARIGFKPMVQLLLDHGANVSITDARGWNAENHAAAGEHLEVVAMLQAEATNRAKCVAFAMGHHARLGVGSPVYGLHPEVLRMVLEYV